MKKSRGGPDKWLLRIGGFCALLVVANGHALDLDDRGVFSVNAFGTLGAVYNESDEVEFRRDVSQPNGPKGEWSALPDTIVGAQLNAKPAADWEAVLQVVSRYDYSSNYDPRLMWAFVKYSPDPVFTVRLGRVGYDAYMESDSRNVGYSYLTVRQPIEYFGTLEQSVIDGGDVLFKTPLGGGLLSAKLFGGQADDEVPVSGGENYDLTDSEILGGYVDYRHGDWHFRAGRSQIELEREVPSVKPLLSFLRGSGSPSAVALADDLSLEGKRVVNWNLGAVYQRGALQAQFLYNRRQSETLFVADGDATYTLLAYRVSAVTPYLGYVNANGQGTKRGAGILPPSTARSLSTTGLFEQRTWLAGVRYDFAQNADLKFQLDYINVPHPPGNFFDADPEWNGYATVFSATLDFIF